MAARQFAHGARAVLRDLIALSKPKVTMMIVFTAAIGAALAMLHKPVSPQRVLLALAGIALVSASAAAFNCLAESYLDARMKRTRLRPLPDGRLGAREAACWAGLLGVGGMWLTVAGGGALTGWLTAATFLGYAVIYTLCLKKATPQNIVIGGASGAMPPVLGWVAATGELTHEPFLLFLIIFLWTPPHFWALALYRTEDYARAGLPMLPVTHGKPFTATQIVLYSVILFSASLLPFASGMSGVLYLAAATVLGMRFVWLSVRVRRTLADADGRRLFAFSITYLLLLFAALLADAAVRAYLIN